MLSAEAIDDVYDTTDDDLGPVLLLKTGQAVDIVGFVHRGGRYGSTTAVVVDDAGRLQEADIHQLRILPGEQTDPRE